MYYCYNCGKKTTLNKSCTNCNTVFWINPRCCAGTLIVSGDNILLVKRAREPWKNNWDIPGGYCEAHEHPKDCAIRETLEETGLNIEIIKFHGIWTEPSSDKGIYGDNICIYYISKPKDSNLKIMDKNEILEIKWFNIMNLPPNIAFPNHIPYVLETYLRSL